MSQTTFQLDSLILIHAVLQLTQLCRKNVKVINCISISERTMETVTIRIIQDGEQQLVGWKDFYLVSTQNCVFQLMIACRHQEVFNLIYDEIASFGKN